MQDMDWDDLRYVLVLSRGGRLSTAARHLRVNETTVARRVARIEAALGARLFERVDGMLRTTEIGDVVVRHAERIEVAADEARGAATGTDVEVSGGVRLTAVPMLLNRILLPALPALLKAHPRLRLELAADPRNLNLISREADIALRFSRPDKDYRVVARRLGAFTYAVYGPAGRRSPALPWITYEASLSALPHVRWIEEAIRREPDAGSRLAVNDSDLAVHAIRAGLGRSLLPCSIGDREPKLVRLSGLEPALTRELWLLVHPDLKHLARIRAVIAWIERVIAGLATHNRIDSGRPG